MEDQEGGNGEVKSRRKTWRRLAKEVLIMAIEVDSAVEVVDGADSEDEASVEMVSRVEDVEDIAGVAMRRRPYNKLRIGDDLEL